MEDIDLVREYQKDGTEVNFRCRCGKVTVNEVRTDVPCKDASDGYKKITKRDVRPKDDDKVGAVIWPLGISNSSEYTEVACDNLPEEKKLATVYTKEMNEKASIYDPNKVETEEEEVDELTLSNNEVMKIQSELVDTKEKDGVVTNYYEDGTQEVINPDKTWTHYFCNPHYTNKEIKVMDFESSFEDGNGNRGSKFLMLFSHYMYDLGYNSMDKSNPNSFDEAKYMKLIGFDCDSAEDTKQFKKMYDEEAVAIVEEEVLKDPFYIKPNYKLNEKKTDHEYYLKVPNTHKGQMKDVYFENKDGTYKEILTDNSDSEAYICDNGVPKNIVKKDDRVSDYSFTRTIASRLKADSNLEEEVTPKIVDEYLKAAGIRCETADQAELLINTIEDYPLPTYDKAIKGRYNLRKQVDAAYKEYGLKALENSPQDNVNFVDTIADWFSRLTN